MEKLIEVNNLAFRYDLSLPYLFEDLSFNLHRGEVLCLVGKSGIGKSSLLRLVAKILRPNRGEIKYHSSPTASNNFFSGFVFQDPRLLPWRTVYHNIFLPLETTSISKSEQKQRVEQAISQTKLASLTDRYPHQLSGGQQQRVSLARALATNAPLLLLDEPFSSLDLESKEEMCEILKLLIKDRRLGVVLVTHDLSDIKRFGARCLKL